jgi:hypothetical protein
MNNSLLVIQAINIAAKFILEHWKGYLRRAFPVMWVLLALNLLLYAMGINFFFLNGFIQILILASFAVCWHRYTLLPAIRTASGFPLQFGARETKYCVYAVIYSFWFLICFFFFNASFFFAIAALTFFVITALPMLMAIFIFPAIALDQPVRLRHFLREGFGLLLPFLLGCLHLAFILVIPALLVFVVYAISTSFVHPKLALFIGTAFANIFVVPLLSALAASTTTILFFQVIGVSYEDEKPS